MHIYICIYVTHSRTPEYVVFVFLLTFSEYLTN